MYCLIKTAKKTYKTSTTSTVKKYHKFIKLFFTYGMFQHVGKGIDLRARNVWSFYENKTELEVNFLLFCSFSYPPILFSLFFSIFHIPFHS